MDWELAIDKHLANLKRIVASLIAMAGFGADQTATVPRYRHIQIMRLLRPAESAVRRLIVIMASRLPDQVLPPAKSKPVSDGTAPQGDQTKSSGKPAAPEARSMSSLPLFDALSFGFRSHKRKYVPDHLAPRILNLWSDNSWKRPPPPPQPMPNDPIPVGPASLRMQRLLRVLDELPEYALRLARLRARRYTPPEQRHLVQSKRSAPLKGGLPPGARVREWLSLNSIRQPSHEVYRALYELHGLAVWSMELKLDTS